LICCPFSFRGFREQGLFSERYGHPDGHLFSRAWPLSEGNLGSGLLEEGGDLLSQRRQIPRDDVPHHVGVNTKVVVDDAVPHPRHLLPRDFRVRCPSLIRDTPYRLTDDLDVSENRVLRSGVGEKCFLPPSRVAEDLVDCIPNVCQLEALGAFRRRHRGTASDSTLSRIIGCRLPAVATSTSRPRSFSASSQKRTKAKPLCPGT
jgi:hypothetical protein